MAVLGFIVGLILMLVAYIAISLMGTVFISFMSKKVLQIIYYLLSIKERLRKQKLRFVQKNQALENKYQHKKQRFKQQTTAQQQTLYNTNTKTHLRHLAKDTLKQLANCRDRLSPEIQRTTKHAIKQCVNQLDMEGLIKINLQLSSQQNDLSYLSQTAKKININNQL